MITYITTVIEDYLKPDNPRDKPLAQVDQETFEQLRSVVLNRLNNLDPEQLLSIPDLDYVIYHWMRWSSKEVVAVKLSPIVDSDVHLPMFIEKYLRFSTSHGLSDRVARRMPKLNPQHIEPVTNVSELEPRIQQMLTSNDLTANQRTAGEQFLKSMELIRQGKDPDGSFGMSESPNINRVTDRITPGYSRCKL